jgi:hypothetical protein
VNETLGIAAGIACLAVLVIELILTARWNETYFRSGIPLFRKRLSSSRPLAALEEDLNLTFERDFWSPLTFRQLGDGSVAFRERLLPFPVWLSYYIPLMHGRITCLAEERIEITGCSNWAVPLVAGMIGLRTLLEAGPLLAIVWALFFAAMYGLQAMRFKRVSQVAAAATAEAA